VGISFFGRPHVLSGARVKENCFFIVGLMLHRTLSILVISSAAGKTAVERNWLEMMFSLSPEFTICFCSLPRRSHAKAGQVSSLLHSSFCLLHFLHRHPLRGQK
jgi:hypothetical protein